MSENDSPFDRDEEIEIYVQSNKCEIKINRNGDVFLEDCNYLSYFDQQNIRRIVNYLKKKGKEDNDDD